MRKLYPLALAALMISTGLQAQQKKDYKKLPSFGINMGLFDFRSPMIIRNVPPESISEDNWAKIGDMSAALGLSYLQGISNNFDIAASYFLTSVKYPYRDATRPPRSDKLLHEMDASIRMKMLSDKYFLSPYLSAGIGVSAFDKSFDAFMPVGGGLQFKLGQEVFAFANMQYRVPISSRANYHFVYSIGFAAPLKQRKVEEPKVVPVAVVEPPADTDKDGIPDNVDKCPTVPGIAKYDGCPIPDTDKDGINDELDKCPTVPGIARYNGCPIPDTDNDGINDEEDKCPTVPGIARYNGCPIPDTDGDGVNDEVDKCPTVPGPADNQGCPRIDFQGEDVLFKTGSAALLADGKKELDQVLAFCNEHPNTRFMIEGHTDNTGGAALNQKLSLSRANAAKAYLVSKGVDANRLETVGYGPDKPIADNKTAAGRAKNRRVDFILLK